MRGINRVFLMGYIGSHPELLVSKNGKNYTKINLATTRRGRSDSGDWEDRTDWHRIVVWGQTAKSVCDHLQRGSPVAVEGCLTQIKSVDSAKGTESSQTLVTADQVHFLPRKKEDGITDSAQ